MAVDDSTFKRWRSTRKSMRESLGLKKRSPSKEATSRSSSPKDGLVQRLFSDYDDVVVKSQCSERNISVVRDRISDTGMEAFRDSDIKYALSTLYANGEPERAFELLQLMEDSDAGKLEPYSPDAAMIGADNNRNVTCYLDSTLFAMFARLEDFEAMLYHTFDDPPRRRLVVLLRLWVNMLRAGKHIRVDFMGQLQDALAECGWQEAAHAQQQDASEAFNFITDVLDLPRLTLKRDMYHQGKADQDDHKYTNERTIDVGIPKAKEGKVITLEECMYAYFDERVEIDRQSEGLARRNTIGASPGSLNKALEAENEKKNNALHVEVSEVPETPTEPLPVYEGRPHLAAQGRSPSIFEDKKVHLHHGAVSPSRKNSLPLSASRRRTATIGKTVTMPAFQFFRLIPWYTEGNPNSDLQVAQHFETKRPTVGICLKRFGQNNDGTFYKREDKIDIPLETGIPEFLHDDDFAEERFPHHKFKLSLQSFIVHKGSTIQRGHYISYIRAGRPSSKPSIAEERGYSIACNPEQDLWLKFDDIAAPKIKYVDIQHELDTQCPYLLFYKIVLRDENDNHGRVSMDGRPPSYSSQEGEGDGMSKSTSNGTTDSSGGVSDVPPATATSETVVAPSAPSLSRAISEAESVPSTTTGPRLTISEQPAAPAHGTPRIIAPRSGSVAVPEGTALQPIQVSGVQERAKSVPLQATIKTAPLVTETDLGTITAADDIGKRKPRQSGSSAGGSGSIGRSLSTMFKTRSGSKGRGSPGTKRGSVDLGKMTATQSSTPPVVDEAKETAGEGGGGREGQSVDLGSLGLKSMEKERAGRSKKEKDKGRGGHKRERSLGDRLKGTGHSDKAERECIIM